MKYFSFVVVLCLGLVFSVTAQQDSTVIIPATQDSSSAGLAKGRFDESKVLYRREALGGFHLHTQGWGFNYRRVQNLELMRKQFLDFEFLVIKHPKEYKKTPFNDNAKRYVYGKKNAFGVLRANYGRQKVLYRKERKKGVQISSVVAGGLSLGMLKPVYLEIAYPSAIRNEITQIEKYDEEKHDEDQIFGRGPFLRGLNEMNFYPGGHLRLALNFEYAPEDIMIRAFEVGMNIDVYHKKVPIMAFVDNEQFFLNLYVTWQIGKRYAH